MTVVCLPNCAFLSETSRMLAVFRELEKASVPVVMATHGGPYELVLERENVYYERIEPTMTPEHSRRYLRAAVNAAIPCYETSVLEEHVRSEMAFYRRRNAEVVIVGFTLSAALSARGIGIPLVATHLGSFVPPILERRMYAFSESFDNFVTGLFPQPWVDHFFYRLFMRLPFQKRTFNTVAHDLGIEPVLGLMDLLMGDLTLVTDVPEILGITDDEMESWRPSNRRLFRPSARLAYAGPIFAKLFGSVPDDVLEFLQTEKPKVYVSLASSRKDYVSEVYSTLAGMDVRAVLAAMEHHEELGRSPHVLVKKLLPSHLIMPMCDLAVIHGGQGSVQTAVSAGIPLIGLPLQPEQNFNLRQMERHGAGRCLSLRSLSKGRLRAAIEQVLGSGGYKPSMLKLQAWQSTRDGAFEVARKVRALIGR